MPGLAPAPRAAAQRAGLALTVGLAVATWAALATAQASPWGRYLNHDGVDAVGGTASLAVFVGGWALMLAAMMLPTTYSLVSRFALVVSRRQDGARLVGVLLAGYLAVWLLAGLVARGADLGLHGLDDRYGIIGDRSWLLVAGALGLAGAYQLSSLKQRCLHRCRDPRAVLFTGWHGRRPLLEAFDLGARHGATCVGCCWALMLLLFGVGAGNLGWMLALAAAMAYEKVAPGGERLATPLGLGLLSAAVIVAAQQSGGWT